jgi:hypothetical protein
MEEMEGLIDLSIQALVIEEDKTTFWAAAKFCMEVGKKCRDS